MAKKTETLSETLKILTWNIDARVEEREERLETITRMIKVEQPDVVCLQEVWSGAGSSLAEKTGMFLASESNLPNNKFGNAILIKYDLTLTNRANTVEFNKTGENFKKSNLLSIVVESKSGRKWNIMTSHLAWGGRSESSRVSQVTEVERISVSKETRHLKEDFVQVFTGDFNATPASDCLRYLKGLTGSDRGAFWLDAWELSGDESSGYTSTPENPMVVSIAKKFNNITRTDLLPKRRIDFIMIRGWRYGAPGYPLASKLIGTPDSLLKGESVPSDHYGVLSELWDPSI